MQKIPYPGFISGTYTNASISVDGEKTVNFMPEVVESGHGKNNVFLMGTPGLKKLVSAARAGLDTLPDGPIRGLWAGAGRLFVVAGASVFEVFQDWTYNLLGNVARVNTPAQIFANGVQLFIVSGGQGYLTEWKNPTDPTSVTLVPVIPATTGEYMDTFFIAQTPDSNKFQISGSLDGSSWDPLDFASKEGDAYNIISTIVCQETLTLLGERSTEAWIDVGGANFPFQRQQGAVIEQGCGATFSPARIGQGMIAWLGYDARGEGVVWKATGYTPVRISNYCVENALQGYRKAGANLNSAVGVAKQIGGHQLYELHIPEANNGRGACWVYDDTVSQQLGSPQWHERLSWSNGNWAAPWGRYHAYAWGQHIVGDFRNGNLYEESFDYLDDDGTLIHRMRSCPHLHDNGNMVFYGAFWVDAMVGGPSNLLDGAGNPRPPMMMRQSSNDGGYTWGNEMWASVGMTGQYKARARWNRGGRARDRCDKIIVTDPIRWMLINCEVEVEEGTA